MFYMLTTLEVQHIRDVLQELISLADPSPYTKMEAEEALELLDKLQDITCREGLKLFEKQIKLEETQDE